MGAPALAQLVLDLCHMHADLAPDVQSRISECAKRPEAIQGDAGLEPVMVGSCPAMKEVFHAIRRYAPTDAPVLITGESGTGKELVAQALHERSAFRDGPFVPVNCGGLPVTLIASELFGHEKGAFTGAVSRHIGHIERANGGTLLLDEIGDLPPDLQAHFLRFLETRRIDRLGGTEAVPVKTRVIAATNVDLEESVARGRFRRDLFFRLDVLRIHLPPLRERHGDIEILTRFFVQRLANELGVRERLVCAKAIDALKSYPWPGNIRELISKIRRALVIAEGEMLDIRDLELDRMSARPVPQPGEAISGPDAPRLEAKPDSLLDVRQQAEAKAIRAALERSHYNVSKAARELGIARATIYKRMKKLGIEV